MKRVAILSGAAVLLSCFAASAQDPEEVKFFGEAAKKLNTFATYALKVGYPRRAKEVYREVLAEYDSDDEVAREALGFLRLGTAWAPDPNHVFPDRDNPDPAIAKLLARRWKSTATTVGKGHRGQAIRLEEAGETDRAKYHWDRVLRFLPGESTASQAQGLKNYEGFYGTPSDIEILKRSRMMDRLVAEELEKDYPVEDLPEEDSHPLLDKGGIPYQGVATEHFRVYGNWPIELLREAAVYAERSLSFCEKVFAGYEGYPPKRKMITTFAFFKTRDEWREVVRANSNLFNKQHLEFILQNTSGCKLDGAVNPLRLGGVENEATVKDLAVRWPAEQYSGLRCDALVEGIGHAIVGRFLGRNLVFTLAPQKPGATAAGGAPKKLILPDLSSWEEAAVENAWQRTGTSVAKLPLLRAAQFPDDGRIKAWSFCDYMLRRSPKELRDLDRTRSAKTEPQVAEKYEKNTGGGDVGELEHSWRRFWTEETPLLLAVKNKTTPMESASRSGPKWLETFNEIRLQSLRSVDPNLSAAKVDVGWSSQYSADCKMHADYLKQNRSERGPEKEHTQKIGLKAASNKGRTFAQSALVSTKGSNPVKVMAKWMLWPGYRDALLNRGLETVGLYADGQILVMDVTRGQVATPQRFISYHPNGNCRPLGQGRDFSVGTEVALADLGPEVGLLLRRGGHSKIKKLGYPISLHFFSHTGMPRASTIKCTVRAGKDEVPGVLHIGSGGSVGRTSAPGLVVFYPLAPLERGTEYRVKWEWGDGRGIDPFTFATR